MLGGKFGKATFEKATMLDRKIIYFDNAATTPLANEVLEVMLPFMKENFGNKMPEDHIPFAKIQPLFDQQDRVKGETSIWLLTVLRYGY